MKFRLKYSLKIFCVLFSGSFLYLLGSQINSLPHHFQSLFNSRRISFDESAIGSRNLFLEDSLGDAAARDPADTQPPPMSDRRLTASQLSDSLFIRQGNFTFPSLQETFATNCDNRPHASALPIFPFESRSPYDDRIWNQMRFVPEHSQRDDTKFKHILLYYGLNDVTNESFQHCPVNKCFVSGDPDFAVQADVILWMHTLSIPTHQRPPGQIWAVYLLESPFHTPKFPDFQILGANYTINWTATYRHESTLVTPYFKYTPFDLAKQASSRYPRPQRNYAHGKRKLIAWFVSNCGSLNNRLQIVEELQKYIQVDIYGLCGTLKCSRNDYKSCFRMLNRDYKFYLAFENSNCRDYITEKFFLNGLSNDILPIVMGAPEEDYERVAPPHSFIHIDKFKTMKDLAQYLYYLNMNDVAYNEYFSWKDHGLVDTNSYFWCRLCMLAHEGDVVKSEFPNVFDWWFDKTKCSALSKWNNGSMTTT